MASSKTITAKSSKVSAAPIPNVARTAPCRARTEPWKPWLLPERWQVWPGLDILSEGVYHEVLETLPSYRADAP